MATLMRYGCTSDATALTMIVTKARPTWRQYGRRYWSRGRMRRASYALPRTSSSIRYQITRKQPYDSCGRPTGETMGDRDSKSDILQGTLDLMVLQTLAAMGPLHGH